MMTFVSICVRRRFACLAAAISLAWLPADAHGQATAEWTNPAGGAYDDRGNWLNGAPPSAADNAEFDLDASYTVDFNSDHTANRLHVLDGSVTLDLAGQTYTLTSASAGNASSVRVGFGASGEGATLRLLSGELRAVNVSLQVGTASISGQSTTWINSGHFGVGRANVLIEDGGRVESDAGNISPGANQNGVTVTGAGSTWINRGNLTTSDNATLMIEEGGRVENVTGSVSTNDLSGPEITSSVSVSGADRDGNPSTWFNSGNLIVGAFGNGTLAIKGGGYVENTTGFIGSGLSSNGQVTVSDIGSRWVNRDELQIGRFGAGSLTIQDGGNVSNTNGYIGFIDSDNSSGAVTVTGDRSAWINSGFLRVGHMSPGTMTIENDGDVQNLDASIGGGAGAPGAVTVTGVGSNWVNESVLLAIAPNSNGTLTIERGGRVSGDIGWIGGRDSTGSATVNGSGSTWTTSGDFIVGHSDRGIGSLLIEAAGRVENATGFIGHVPGSNGNVTITGAGSVWDTTGSLYVGGNATDTGGEAKLTVGPGGVARVGDTLTLWDDATVRLDGGTITTTAIEFAGSNFLFNRGTLEVTGPQTADGELLQHILGATAVLRPGQTLRFAGSTTLDRPLTIDGGELATRGLNAGNGMFSFTSGSVTIDGGTIGGSGMRTFSLDSASLATLTITGGAEYNVSDLNLTVGDVGRGVLNMPNGIANTGISYVIGRQAGSHGTVNVSGPQGEFAATDEIVVAQQGRGELNVSGGSFVASDSILVASGAGSTGTLNATGSGTMIDANSELVVGASGRGEMQLSDGASVDVGSLRIASAVGGRGFVTLHSSASLTATSISVGSAAGGAGTLEITDGGVATSAPGGELDVHSGSKIVLDGGTLNIQGDDADVNSGASFEFKSGTLNVSVSGNSGLTFGDAELIVPAGGTLNVGSRIGFNNANGLTSLPGSAINVTSNNASLGNGSYFAGVHLQGKLNVGAFAVFLNSAGPAQLGALTLMNGGSIENGGSGGVALGAGDVLIGHGAINDRVAAAPGSVIQASGSLSLGDSTAFDGYVSDGALAVTGHTVTLLDQNQAKLGASTTIGGGTLTAANGLVLDFGDAISGRGIIATPNDLLRPTIINGHVDGLSESLNIEMQGYVKGVGMFDNVSFTGTFDPGLSPAVLHVGSIALSPTSTLIMELGGTTPGDDYDQIIATGSLTLAGTLEIVLTDDFMPSASDAFELIAANSIVGTFENVVVTSSTGGGTFDVVYTPEGLMISEFVPPGLPGDFNADGAVDAADYVVWRKTAGTPEGYGTWRANFGRIAGSGATAGLSSSAADGTAAVPEPSAIASLLVSISLIWFGSCRRRYANLLCLRRYRS